MRSHIDLFTGIGGFSLACQWNDIETVVMCEPNKQCQSVLRRHYPNTPIINTVQEILNDADKWIGADIITGGDPCPIRSRARSNGKSRHPDLSGYFLAMVGKCRPRWVVRENVLAPDDIDFMASLEVMGYRTAIVRSDASSFTGQRRVRDFIIGSIKKTWPGIAKSIFTAKDHSRLIPSRLGTLQIIPCLTAHRTRYDSRDCYIWDGQFRILDGEERTSLAGLPVGWLAGFSEASIARMTGNAVVPQVAYQIIKAIKEADNA